MGNDQVVKLDGKVVFPSFRIERGEYKTQLDLDHGVIAIMHPYDIVQGLAEQGKISQALAALEGFIRREIDIKVEAAYTRNHMKHRKEGDLE